LKKINWQAPLKLFDVAQTRQLEAAAAALNSGPQSLMESAGLAIAKLAMAIQPFANCHWIFCGPGNNGGDGLEAATHLQAWGQRVQVVLWQPHSKRPTDSEKALKKVQSLAIAIQDHLPLPEELHANDLIIDALLGVGIREKATTNTGLEQAHQPRLEDWIADIYAYGLSVLAVDIPSGLNANTGNFQDEKLQGLSIRATHTLQLLNAKPGCFTAHGRDACGTLWSEDLGTEALQENTPSAALLNHQPLPPRSSLHASHKGSFGDVAVVGGESLNVRGMGMTGAVDLAASAALHAGAGRVMTCFLSDESSEQTPQQPTSEFALYHNPVLPEIMPRSFKALHLSSGVVVCGCGGGIAIQKVLPQALQESTRLVLDADALNAISQDPWLQELLKKRSTLNQTTVITPHPLEAARLLNTDTSHVQQDRLKAAQCLAALFDCTVVLKGSGTVIAQTAHTSVINPTGNARLATAGTGDVLAGVVGARLAQGLSAFDAACAAVFEHGQAADLFQGASLTAGTLAQLIRGPQTAS
jgi:hydroxyethylthiazole kinase-like uncharacterized protein yjeF